MGYQPKRKKKKQKPLRKIKTSLNNIQENGNIIIKEADKRSAIVIHGGARGVMVIVAGIGHGDTSSNPGLIVFHIALIFLGKV